MRQKDFIRLPLEKFKLTDGIYNYNLRKSLCKDGTPCYTVKEECTGESMFMIESFEKQDEEDYYKRTILTVLISCGGLTTHSKDNWNIFHKLTLLPRGSFAEFIKRTKLKS